MQQPCPESKTMTVTEIYNPWSPKPLTPEVPRDHVPPWPRKAQFLVDVGPGLHCLPFQGLFTCVPDPGFTRVRSLALAGLFVHMWSGHARTRALPDDREGEIKNTVKPSVADAPPLFSSDAFRAVEHENGALFPFCPLERGHRADLRGIYPPIYGN